MEGLVGYTGFVGQALDRQHQFCGRFNRANIATLADASFDTLICAAAPGSMVEANKNAQADRDAIEDLMHWLGKARADRFILISTIAAIASFDCRADESTTNFREDLAYGRHRHMLEAFCLSTFPNCLIVRLPSLFGCGLKKNFIFDIMNPLPTFLSEARYAALHDAAGPALAPIVAALYDFRDGFFHIDRHRLAGSEHRGALEAAALQSGAAAIGLHHPESTFQFCNVAHLWADIQKVIDAGINTIHLVPEPLAASEINQRLRGSSMWQSNAGVHREDIQTIHGALWQRDDRYIGDAATTLDELEAFAGREDAHR